MVLEKGRRITVEFGSDNNLKIEAVLMPDGSIVYPVNAIGLFLGKSKDYIVDGGRKTKKTLEAWSSKGFTARKISAQISQGSFGLGRQTRISGVSSNDFKSIILGEATLKNPIAIALVSASFAEVLESRERHATGDKQLTIEQKLVQFTEKYDEAYELALLYNRQDLEDIEQQELFQLDQQQSQPHRLSNFRNGKPFYASYATDSDCYQAHTKNHYEDDWN